MKYDIETIYFFHIKQKIDLSASFAKNCIFLYSNFDFGSIERMSAQVPI